MFNDLQTGQASRRIRRAIQGLLAVAAAVFVAEGLGAIGGEATPNTATSVTPRDGSIEAALTNAESDVPNLYAGALYHRDNGTYSVYGPTYTLDQLKAYFRENVAGDAFDTIEFVGVERSLDELYAIQQEIMQDHPWFEEHGIKLARASIVKELGIVEIGLFNYSPEAEQLILEHFGADRVRVDPENDEQVFDVGG